MTENLEANFTKKVTTLPDGRRLIYYNFTPETDAAASVPAPQQESEAR
jgi:hypothetical protein